MLVRSSFTVAMKLVPLLEQMTPRTPPQPDTILSIPMTQLLVSIDDVTSKWTTRVVRQVKRNPQHFSVERLDETQKVQSIRSRGWRMEET